MAYDITLKGFYKIFGVKCQRASNKKKKVSPIWSAHSCTVSPCLSPSVYLLADVRWRPRDGRGLSHPPPPEDRHQPPRQRRRLPGQPSRPLEPGDRHGARAQTGWHRFNAAQFIIDRLANVWTDAHGFSHAETHLQPVETAGIKSKRKTIQKSEPAFYSFKFSLGV